MFWVQLRRKSSHGTAACWERLAPLVIPAIYGIMEAGVRRAMAERRAKVEAITGAIGRAWRRAGDWLLAVGCFLLSLLLYLQTLAPSVATLLDDSLEFPLAAHRLAIAHATGYPLYMLLGKLFSLGPWSNVAWAVNALSAVAGALTVALTYLIGRELTRPGDGSVGRRWPALLGAAALAVSPVFWSQAVIAEVYTLNSAFFAALLWLALRWARRPLLPVEPFSLLLVSPWRERTLFLPGAGLWLRLPPGLRRAAHRLHGAGVRVGVVVLLGLGGRRYADAHERDTVAVLRRMVLGRGDIVYFSPLIAYPGLEYDRMSRVGDWGVLDSREMRHQQHRITAALEYSPGAPLTSMYDIRDFIY